MPEQALNGAYNSGLIGHCINTYYIVCFIGWVIKKDTRDQFEAEMIYLLRNVIL